MNCIQCIPPICSHKSTLFVQQINYITQQQCVCAASPLCSIATLINYRAEVLKVIVIYVLWERLNGLRLMSGWDERDESGAHKKRIHYLLVHKSDRLPGRRRTAQALGHSHVASTHEWPAADGTLWLTLLLMMMWCMNSSQDRTQAWQLWCAAWCPIVAHQIAFFLCLSRICKSRDGHLQPLRNESWRSLLILLMYGEKMASTQLFRFISIPTKKWQKGKFKFERLMMVSASLRGVASRCASILLPLR